MHIKHLLALALVVFPLASQAETLRSLSVSGASELTVAPDLATLRLGVENRSDTAEAALAETTQKVEALLARLAANGIAPDQIQTSQLTLNPVYAYDNAGSEPPRPSSYSASNIVTLTTTDLEGLGALISLASEAGANRIEGLSFDLENKIDVLNEARRAAVSDARARAKLYAEAADVQLGPLLTLSENGTGYQMPPVYLQAMEMRGLAKDVPISGGTITVSATIEATFAIE